MYEFTEVPIILFSIRKLSGKDENMWPDESTQCSIKRNACGLIISAVSCVLLAQGKYQLV